MPAKRYRVRLTPAERKELDREVNTGTGSAQRLRRARILLIDEAQAGGGWIDADIQGLRCDLAHRQRIRENHSRGSRSAVAGLGWRGRSAPGAVGVQRCARWTQWRCRCWPISWSN